MRISDWSSDVCSSDRLRFSDATFDLTGGSGGASPEAQNDTATGAEDSAIVIDVLGNDSSPGGGALTVAAVTQGANGSVTINPDNSLTYTPTPDFFGTDSFAYKVSDGAGSATATVSVTVTHRSGFPVRTGEETVRSEDDHEGKEGGKTG